MAPAQTKITMKVWVDLFDGFSKKLDRCFIKRDAFLNHIISKELNGLRQGLQGKTNSPAARRYITSELAQLGTKPINVVVDKEVAKRLNSIVKDHNVPRDAFINRLILLLTLPDKALSRVFGVSLDLYAHEVYDQELTLRPKGFAEALPSLFNDPNCFIQEELDASYDSDSTDPEKNIYTKTLKAVKIANLAERDGFLIGLSCYLEDSDVPNTEAWQKKRAELRKDEELEFPDFDFLVDDLKDKGE